MYVWSTTLRKPFNSYQMKCLFQVTESLAWSQTTWQTGFLWFIQIADVSKRVSYCKLLISFWQRPSDNGERQDGRFLKIWSLPWWDAVIGNYRSSWIMKDRGLQIWGSFSALKNKNTSDFVPSPPGISKTWFCYRLYIATHRTTYGIYRIMLLCSLTGC